MEQEQIKLKTEATSSHTDVNVNQVLEDIDRIKKEIEELEIRNLEGENPQYNEHAKTLKQIRSFLAKKTKADIPSKINLWKKMTKTFKRKRGLATPSEILMEPTPSEFMEFMDSTGGGSCSFFEYSVDEAFMYGVECVLTVLNILKSSQ